VNKTQHPLTKVPAQAELAAVADRSQPLPGDDPLAMLLADKRSPATRRAYAADLRDFFGSGTADPSPGDVRDFLALSATEIGMRLAKFKGAMIARSLSEATINRRLTAVRSLLKFSYRVGLAVTDGRGLVEGETPHTYRDTRGVDTDTIKRLLALPDELHGAATVRALRDLALLRVLFENALRRAEVCSLDVGDFSLTEKRLSIVGKGKTQKAPVTLSPGCAEAVARYLVAAGHASDEAGPLFRNLDRRHTKGRRTRPAPRLTPEGLYDLVRRYGTALGVKLAPHKLRHSAITAILDATSGDVRTAQRLSRHKDVRTLQIYDDNREDLQGRASRMLSDLSSPKAK
jgi:integrase/recombinase XerC